MKASEIRSRFVKFFESKNHLKIASSGLIPLNDKTLLFNNAGMNQFKDIFTGKAKPQSSRAVTIQKCVRAGGKHNDLENVGLTARHHTFFEMLGNFSFGDYFKQEAIAFAWEFLTEELSIDKDKLYVTVHHSDDEAFNIWKDQIKISEDRIFRKGDKDNFWEMGEFGPCGPCSEIFYDHGEEHSTPDLVISKDGDILDDEMRYVEIWNLVFMQFEKTPEGTIELPNPSIDTGAGLERLAAAMQGVYWNYDSDLFMPIIHKIESLCGKSYKDDKYSTPMRIVADHIRSATMLITDGVIPSNEGRGYVLRRIIRRAIKNLKDLEMPTDVLKELVPVTFEILSAEYPQNKANQAVAEKFLTLEESKFYETLDQGLKYLNKALESEVSNGKLDGKAAFKLYDTYGFPLDLTQIILTEKGIELDQAGFDSEMQKRKEDSKKSWKGSFNLDDKVFHQAKEKNGATDFCGYDTLECTSKLLDIIELDGSKGLIFGKTPFYGESGGQAGDQGAIFMNGEMVSKVSDTMKPVEGLHLHIADVDADVKVGQEYTLKVCSQTRALSMRNHSATHLLQAALIKTLGDHVKQAGSSVNHQKLRFDFTHPQALTESEIERAEELVNQQILKAISVETNEMTMDEAINEGALAFFGEKYADKVRVLKMGDFSVELCGGTHVKNTADIGLFTITAESSLSAGVRRVEGITSSTAIAQLQERSKVLKSVEKLFKVKGEATIDKVVSLQNDIKAKNKSIKELNEKIQASQSDDLFKDPESLGSDHVLKVTEVSAGSDLKKLSDLFMDKNENGVLIIHSSNQDKLQVLLRGPKSLKAVNLSNVLKESLPLIDGRGGGKPFMAQGSGSLDNKEQFLSKLKESLVSAMS
jgi:alanyl-tRNA synthetase